MDSLLTSYASSDDEPEQEEEEEAAGSLSKPSSSISTQLPPPKSKLSLFSSLPLPKTSAPPSSSSSSLFSLLPPPNQSNGSKPIKSQPSSKPNPKRVVQVTVPLNPSLLKPDDFDDDEEEERKPIKDFSDSTSSKALSSMLPAPRNSLCLAPTAASRRSVVDSDVISSSSNRESFERKQESSNFDNLGSLNVERFEGGEQERGNFEGFESYPVEQGASGHENYGSYDGYENYGSYGNGYGSGSGGGDGGGGDYGSYEGNWSEGNSTMAVAPTTLIPELGRIGGKRGRNEIPAEIVEVNQAELIKNRPRADQAKLTGIAFGPAYQPVSTSKGKPTKLQKRKHQIGTLYYDMKQKEMELSERRSKGFLTKAETQAKYGW